MWHGLPPSDRRLAPSDRRLGWLVLAAAAVLVLAVQVAQPVGIPLYDGVVVQEPYRFLHPSGDQAGSPTSYTGELAVSGDTSPILSAYTAENPPQAQLIAQRNAFALTPGATNVLIAVTPVEPPSTPPPKGRIVGNVYRFSVTDQSGTPLQVRDCPGCMTLRMRAPEDTSHAVLMRYADGTWHDVETFHEGIAGTYVTNVLALGDYAVVSLEEIGSGDIDPVFLVGGGAVVLLVLIGLFLLLRVRQAPPEPEPAPRTRIPSKRKGRR
jgi:hypothetical protein